jgi:uncharacterized protein
MKIEHNKIIFSPSDLANHISCKHLTNLNKKAALGELKKPAYKYRVLDMLRERGLKFEEFFLQQLRIEGNLLLKSIKRIAKQNKKPFPLWKMENGVDVIYQARLVEKGIWGGWSDFILKLNTPRKRIFIPSFSGTFNVLKKFRFILL